VDRACVEECPVEAIDYEDDLPQKWQIYTEDNARFFSASLPGHTAPLGSPGGAGRLGPLGVDTELVTKHPAEPPSQLGGRGTGTGMRSHRPRRWGEFRQVG
jgi:ferredoxin